MAALHMLRRPAMGRAMGLYRKQRFPEVFLPFLYTGSATAAHPQPAGTRNSAPAEDVDNKNPSLVALGNMNARTRERARAQAMGRAMGHGPAHGPGHGPGHGPWALVPKTSIFLRFFTNFYTTAARRQRTRSAPAAHPQRTRSRPGRATRPRRKTY